MNQGPIIVACEYPYSTSLVWQALTRPEQLRQWLFEPIDEFKAEVSFTTQFDVCVEEQSYTHLWEVSEVQPESRLVYRWRYVGYDGDSSVCWQLRPAGKGSHLVLTHSGVESFPQDDPIFARETGVAGWEYLLNKSLRSFLERVSK
ncbi:MAG: SRPBCC domain-containing protein [Pseudomonadota bacterium]